MTEFVISKEQRENFDNSVKCLCAKLKQKGEECIDIVPDFAYLYENGKWIVSGNGFAETLEEILLYFSKYESADGKTQEELFDILLEYMEIDEEYLELFDD